MLREQVLYLLEKNRGQVITGGEIARRLGVSRTAVWKSVRALRESGSDIESLPNSGYRMTDESDGLSWRAINDSLRTRKFGRNMELLPTLSSTNKYLKQFDSAAIEEGYTVVANEQTEGRGRMNRPFHSPAHEGIYFSVLLKPAIPIADTPFLTICAAVAVCRAIWNICGLSVDIKWVNDIYLEGKKLCGILTEASISAELRSVEDVVVGIGLNTGRVAREVEETAISLYGATGIRGVRNRLIAEILNEFEEVYLDYTVNGRRGEILDAYAGRMFIIGRRAMVEISGASSEVTILGVDDSGELIVEREDGLTCHIDSGEIKLI